MNRIYASIDLKSFYASVECQERKLNPLTTNLVVADITRTEKTICLAVSPSLKKYGIGGRARLFEVIQKLREVNKERKYKNKINRFVGKSYDSEELKNNPNLEISYLVAPPRMATYLEYSTKIYNVYLKYIAPEDIYAYSIDEIFCDLTKYLRLYKLTPEELVTKMIADVYNTTGITATSGIGTNMYLCKVAMDIMAKHAEPNKAGVRIAKLDEMSYRKLLWGHKPLTDFWRVGKGYANRLSEYNIYTMGDIARCSITNEELLYKIFGINAELLIDHSWGYEPTTIEDVKAFKPQAKSLCSGQVLLCSYDYEKTKVVIKEMAEAISLDLVSKNYVTDQLVLHIDYDIECLTNPEYSKYYLGEIVTDRYGRSVPKPAHGTHRLKKKTSSTKLIVEGFLKLYDIIINKKMLIKKINIYVANLSKESEIREKHEIKQFDLFTDYEEQERKEKAEKEDLEKEHKMQETLLNLRNRFGKNAILKGTNLKKESTAIERNNQIGGHKA